MQNQIANLVSVEFDRSGSTLTVYVDGQLDLSSAPGLAEAVQANINGVERVVLDLAEVSFCDSSGLRAFVALHETMTALGGTLALQDPTAMMRRMLTVTGMVDLFPVHGKS